MRSQLSNGATAWRREPYVIMIAATLAVFGAIVLFYATPHGIGASPDSATFISTARQLHDVQSLLTLPNAHQPPIYPLVLAGTAVTGVDPLAGARWLHALLFAANIVLFVYILDQLVYRLWLLGAGASLFLFAAPMLTIHTFAWSEPLFIFIAFSGLALIALFIDNSRRSSLLVGALLIGLACLTRYAGIPLIATGALGILLLARATWRQRLFNAALFTLLSAMPLLFWLARNRFVAGATTSRQLAFHPAGRAHLWQIFYTLSGWLQIPDAAPNAVRLLILFSLLSAAGAILFFGRRGAAARGAAAEEPSSGSLVRLLLLFALIYVTFLLLSITLFDANTPLDNRLLAPLFVAVLPVALFFLQKALHLTSTWKPGAPLAAAPLVLLATLTVLQSLSQLQEQRYTGLGYNSPTWQRSPLLAQIDNIPQNTAIFSNAPEAIILLQNREAQALPRRNDAMSQITNESYQQELDALGTQVQSGTAVIAYFHSLAHRPVTSESELREQFALDTVAQAADGVILGAGRQVEP